LRIVEVPFNYEVLAADGRRMGEGRSVGLHLSDVIRYMRATLKGEAVTPFAPGAGLVHLAMGFMFELVVERIETGMRDYFGGQRGLVINQGEMELDKIFMTPDGLNVEDGCLEEYKWTRLSIKKILDAGAFQKHFWYWLVQIMANCWGQGTTRGRLIACFANGDYSWKKGEWVTDANGNKSYMPNGEPTYVQRDFYFTEEELKANWSMVLSCAQEMREKGLVAA
jgi:hypothetical protein